MIICIYYVDPYIHLHIYAYIYIYLHMLICIYTYMHTSLSTYIEEKLSIQGAFQPRR